MKNQLGSGDSVSSAVLQLFWALLHVYNLFPQMLHFMKCDSLGWYQNLQMERSPQGLDDYTSLVHAKPEIFEQTISWKQEKGKKILPYVKKKSNDFKLIFSGKNKGGVIFLFGEIFFFHLQNVFNLWRLFVLGLGPYFCSNMPKRKKNYQKIFFECLLCAKHQIWCYSEARRIV